MNKSLRFKLILVLLILAGALWFLYPTFRLIRMGAEGRAAMGSNDPEGMDKIFNKSIKLGLDLSGGMYIVLEIDDSKLDENERRDVMDRALKVIRNRVDQFGVLEPDIKREGQKRIIIQLPGLQDADRAKRLIGQTAMLEWRLIRQQLEMKDVVNRLDEVIREAQGDSLIEVPDASGELSLGAIPPPPAEMEGVYADSMGGSDTLALPADSAAGTAVPLQTVNKDRPFSSLITHFYYDWVFVHEDNIPRLKKLLARPETQKAIPQDSKLMWLDEWITLAEGKGRGKHLFLVAMDEVVSGKNLQNAVPQPDPKSPNRLIVNFQFNRTGARELSRFTGKNIDRFTAIILDGKIKSYPRIESKIPNGRGYIEGMTDQEAKDLAIVLRAGALPADMIPREERTVGPSLGADSIRMGIRAAIIGLIVVILFMVLYYKLSGVVASLALIFNLIILFGLLAYLGAALTLPGIAGIILTIGMAIDANVLIFERIREELRKAKTIRSSIDAGYERAFTTILDANLTTLITAVVLWQFGTGPIKGFATTLSIGIIGSMFTALIFSRLVFDLWTRSGKVKKLSI
ncbi:MAG: protein translocase subunit SecD [Candidatus Krumholzibacteriota bacterium]|nr:protein translocase subunit SecD [Candidatus Krumholzibacteriota bacterium]